MPVDVLAFDASGSARSVDANGYMHVAVSHITKAQVVPYRGREIPNWQELGLDSNALYYAYRSPEELVKSLPTWNGVPLLIKHHPDSAETPQKALRVGSMGTEAVWNDPYVDNALVVWDKDAIKGIEDGTCKELSCGYRYKPDFTDGEVDGVHYDFVMRDIRGNHVALVADGRAGADVVVADSAENLMKGSVAMDDDMVTRQGQTPQPTPAGPGQPPLAPEYPEMAGETEPDPKPDPLETESVVTVQGLINDLAKIEQQRKLNVLMLLTKLGIPVDIDMGDSITEKIAEKQREYDYKVNNHYYNPNGYKYYKNQRAQAAQQPQTPVPQGSQQDEQPQQQAQSRDSAETLYAHDSAYAEDFGVSQLESLTDEDYNNILMALGVKDPKAAGVATGRGAGNFLNGNKPSEGSSSRDLRHGYAIAQDPQAFYNYVESRKADAQGGQKINPAVSGDIPRSAVVPSPDDAYASYTPSGNFEPYFAGMELGKKMADADSAKSSSPEQTEVSHDSWKKPKIAKDWESYSIPKGVSREDFEKQIGQREGSVRPKKTLSPATSRPFTEQEKKEAENRHRPYQGSREDEVNRRTRDKMANELYGSKARSGVLDYNDALERAAERSIRDGGDGSLKDARERLAKSVSNYRGSAGSTKGDFLKSRMPGVKSEDIPEEAWKAVRGRYNFARENGKSHEDAERESLEELPRAYQKINQRPESFKRQPGTPPVSEYSQYDTYTHAPREYVVKKNSYLPASKKNKELKSAPSLSQQWNAEEAIRGQEPRYRLEAEREVDNLDRGYVANKAKMLAEAQERAEAYRRQQVNKVASRDTFAAKSDPGTVLEELAGKRASTQLPDYSRPKRVRVGVTPAEEVQYQLKGFQPNGSPWESKKKAADFYGVSEKDVPDETVNPDLKRDERTARYQKLLARQQRQKEQEVDGGDSSMSVKSAQDATPETLNKLSQGDYNRYADLMTTVNPRDVGRAKKEAEMAKADGQTNGMSPNDIADSYLVKQNPRAMLKYTDALYPEGQRARDKISMPLTMKELGKQMQDMKDGYAEEAAIKVKDARFARDAKPSNEELERRAAITGVSPEQQEHSRKVLEALAKYVEQKYPSHGNSNVGSPSEVNYEQSPEEPQHRAVFEVSPEQKEHSRKVLEALAKFGEQWRPRDEDAAGTPAESDSDSTVSDSGDKVSKDCRTDTVQEVKGMDSTQELMAMDVNAIRKEVTQSLMSDFKARTNAARMVRGVIGDVDPMAFDSANAIFGEALKSVGVNTANYDERAYESMFDAYLMGHSAGAVGFAQDSKPHYDGEFEGSFAGLKNISVGE